MRIMAMEEMMKMIFRDRVRDRLGLHITLSLSLYADDGDGGDDEDNLHDHVVVGQPVPEQVEVPVRGRVRG